jgi:transcriptional regulator with XRE-family HTH domain
MKPSIDTAKKLADALEVSLDYLVGDAELKILDKKTMQRLEDIERLPEEDKNNIFYTLDNLIKAAKLKSLQGIKKPTPSPKLVYSILYLSRRVIWDLSGNVSFRTKTPAEYKLSAKTVKFTVLPGSRYL